MNSFILFLSIFRYVFSVRFRQLEGLTIALRRMFPILPSIDYSWIRRRIIRPRRNARIDRRPASRRSSARMIRDYGYDIWRRVVGYGKRWMAETAISVFKSIFGEEILSKKPRWMRTEIVQKAFIYNLLLNAA